jgi:hypothetical protein
VADAAVEEPVAKRRSARQSAATPSKLDTTVATKREPDTITQPLKRVPKKKEKATIKSATKPSPADEKKSKTGRTSKDTAKPATAKTAVTDSETRDSARAVSEDPDPKDIPTHNPEAEKHEGTWYWLLKAEPETRIENGIDISFSIDDLRSKTKPEGWDGEFFSPHVLCGLNG